MAFLFCTKKNQTAKTCIIGNTLDAMVMTTSLCKSLAEKISAEKNISYESAITFLLESISEGITKIDKV